MATLGEELKRRREERSISLAEISEATRIGTRFLKAIETDNYSILPGGIYTRNFIRSYAGQVGMNEEEAIALYNQQVAGQSAEPPPQPVLVAPTLESRTRRPDPVVFRQSASRTNWPTIVIAAGIALLMGVIVLALVKKLGSGPEQAAQPPAEEAQAAKQTPPPAEPAKAAPAQPDAGQQSAPVPTGEPLAVKLEATTGDSWIRYQVDDAKPVVMVLRPGEAQDLPPAQNQVKLNIGNRQTLKLKINSRDASFPPNTKVFAAQVIISRDNLQSFFQ